MQARFDSIRVNRDKHHRLNRKIIVAGKHLFRARVAFEYVKFYLCMMGN